MCGVTCEQHAPAAIRYRLTRHVGEAGDPVRAVHAVVLAVNPDERVADVLQGGLIGEVQLGHDEGDPHPPMLGWTDATTATQAELRHLLHLDLGNDPARGWIPAGEIDSGRLAHNAAASFATNHTLARHCYADCHPDTDLAVP